MQDEDVPLANNGNNLTEEQQNSNRNNENQEIEDEDVPLANVEADQHKMSWWWLLIVALLGVTGEEMYRRHRRKAVEANNMENK